jgi:hypothetical protein
LKPGENKKKSNCQRNKNMEYRYSTENKRKQKDILGFSTKQVRNRENWIQTEISDSEGGPQENQQKTLRQLRSRFAV